MPGLLPRGTSWPSLTQWLENELALTDHFPMRVESYSEGSDYVIRCELPGMDPERDIQITMEGNELKITAERTSEQRDDHHTEFQYGSFARSMTLPSHCDMDNITANYESGILTLRVPKKQTSHTKEIPVARSGQ